MIRSIAAAIHAGCRFELRQSRLGLAMVLGALAVASFTPSAMAASHSQRGQDASACFWFGPYVKDNPGFNVGFPDTGAAYWSANIAMPVGSKIVLRGQYAHARYQSVSAYEANGAALDSLTDYQIAPDRGSRNPFLPGERRTGEKNRSFTVEIRNEAVPASYRASNTLYAKASASDRQILIFRLYVPDKNRDLTGGVGLPTPELVLADGRRMTGKAACAALNVAAEIVPIPIPTKAQYAALRDRPGAPDGFPAQNPPVFHAFYNPKFRTSCLYSLNPGVDCRPATAPARAGGLYPNIDNNYIAAYLSRRYGKVLVFRGKLPTVPTTYNRTPRSSEGQLRYWSICQTESIATTRTTSCLYDEQVPIDSDRNYVIVSSRDSDRPKNATAKCGVGFLSWSAVGDGAGHLDDAYIYVRNLLPASSFSHANQNTKLPGDEAAVLGDYLPRGEYMSIEEFEKMGCPASRDER